MLLRPILLGMLFIGGWSLHAAAPPTPTPVERAQAAVQQLKMTLVKELTDAIAKGGVVSAVGVCGDVAKRTATAQQQPDLRIGRTSSKLRNPNNTAPTWVTAPLHELEQTPPAKRTARTVALPSGTGYVEPLTAVPLCLQCHGTAIASDVQAAIRARYPQDQATGFREGDLRGVVWVEVTTSVAHQAELQPR